MLNNWPCPHRYMYVARKLVPLPNIAKRKSFNKDQLSYHSPGEIAKRGGRVHPQMPSSLLPLQPWKAIRAGQTNLSVHSAAERGWRHRGLKPFSGGGEGSAPFCSHWERSLHEAGTHQLLTFQATGRRSTGLPPSPPAASHSQKPRLSEAPAQERVRVWNRGSKDLSTCST